MSSSANIHVEALLDELVQQFSNPVACFRELVQNALDAGTQRIDISFDWEVSEVDDRSGTMVAEVRDFGEGMDRRVVERQLTRLFSSAKDEDYTKIGQFGIGFVSVFALEPFCVCIDTGKSGEYWRVLFDGRRSFELIELDEPIEGTRVRIYKHMDRPDFEQFRRRAREAIEKWCKHARAPIYIDGEDIRQTFDVEAYRAVTHTEEGTRLVVGLTDRQAPRCGYYNRGLTLKEREDGPWPHVAFKIDSRYLEHTLTRDELLEDADFQKAHELIERRIHRELPADILGELERLAGDPEAAGRHDELCGAWRTYIENYTPPDDWDRADGRRWVGVGRRVSAGGGAGSVAGHRA